MLHKALAEILKGARVFTFELDPVVRLFDLIQRLDEAPSLVQHCAGFGRALERRSITCIAARAKTDHGQRHRFVRIFQAKIQCRARPHRTADNVSLLYFEVPHHRR